MLASLCTAPPPLALFHCAGADKTNPFSRRGPGHLILRRHPRLDRGEPRRMKARASPITKRLSGAVESVSSTKRLFSRLAPGKKRERMERRNAHCPTNVRVKRGVRTVFFQSRPPFGAHACGTRHRLLPRWLSSRTGFPAAAARRRFSRFANTKKRRCRRLSTLRADRSLCRSTGDPKPPGSGSDKLSRAGTASRSRQSRHRLTSLTKSETAPLSSSPRQSQRRLNFSC